MPAKTSKYQKEHIRKSAHFVYIDIKKSKEHMPKRAYAEKSSCRKEHVPKRAHAKKEQMSKRAHGKKSTYQKKHIPKSAHFVYIEFRNSCYLINDY